MSNNKFPKDLIPLGKILKPRGLKGELKAFLYNKSSRTLTEEINIWLKIKNKYNIVNIEYLKEYNKYIIVKFRDINCREDAEKILNRRIYVSRNDFPDSSTFYLVDLIGFVVRDKSGNIYGKVKDVINLPTNNSLLIDYNDKEILIPIIDNFIKLFDYENRMIIIKNSNIFINKC